MNNVCSKRWEQTIVGVPWEQCVRGCNVIGRCIENRHGNSWRHSLQLFPCSGPWNITRLYIFTNCSRWGCIVIKSSQLKDSGHHFLPKPYITFAAAKKRSPLHFTSSSHTFTQETSPLSFCIVWNCQQNFHYTCQNGLLEAITHITSPHMVYDILTHRCKLDREFTLCYTKLTSKENNCDSDQTIYIWWTTLVGYN